MMAERTGISWTDATFNAWRGCSKISDGCRFCYAENDISVKMHGITWGPHGTRVKTSAPYWDRPPAWDRRAKEAEKPFRVFCGSLMDWAEDWDGPILDHKGRTLRLCDSCGEIGPDGLACLYCQKQTMCRDVTMDDIRRDLFGLIDATPNLTWQLLSKRPENIERMWPPHPDGGQNETDALWRHNVWLGASVEGQASADTRIAELRKCRDLSPVLFLSCEPLLGPIDFSDRCASENASGNRCTKRVGHAGSHYALRPTGQTGWAQEQPRGHLVGIDWVIVGGESGPSARPCAVEWIDDIRRQCGQAAVSCFVKQVGSNPGTLGNSKGTDPAEWPEELRVQEFPKLESATCS